jgi:hypothetical protein
MTSERSTPSSEPHETAAIGVLIVGGSDLAFSNEVYDQDRPLYVQMVVAQMLVAASYETRALIAGSAQQQVDEAFGWPRGEDEWPDARHLRYLHRVEERESAADTMGDALPLLGDWEDLAECVKDLRRPVGV